MPRPRRRYTKSIYLRKATKTKDSNFDVINTWGTPRELNVIVQSIIDDGSIEAYGEDVFQKLRFNLYDEKITISNFDGISMNKKDDPVYKVINVLEMSNYRRIDIEPTKN